MCFVRFEVGEGGAVEEVDFAAGLLEVRSEDPELFRIYEQERADRARG